MPRYTAIVEPIAATATSLVLAWRDPVSILEGSGIVAMALLLMQPLLAGRNLPGLAPERGRRVHRWIGGALVAAEVTHVAALWVTSPPDVIDALLLASLTRFSIWDVIAMWALLASAVLATFRRRLRLRPLT